MVGKKSGNKYPLVVEFIIVTSIIIVVIIIASFPIISSFSIPREDTNPFSLSFFFL